MQSPDKDDIRKFSGNEEISLLTLYRSYDDKAYLCPSTSTGMQSLRCQKLYQTTDENTARKFRKYDFPNSMVSCALATFNYVGKSVSNFEAKVQFTTEWQHSIVRVKPKYFIGSSGTVWSSHIMQIRQKEPLLHEIRGNGQACRFQPNLRGIFLKLHDHLRHFIDQTVKEDISLVKTNPQCPFRGYEVHKVTWLLSNLMSIRKEFEQVEECFEDESAAFATIDVPLSSLIQHSGLLKELFLCASAIESIWSAFEELIDYGVQCISVMNMFDMPKFKPYVIDLKDALPGIGIHIMMFLTG